jgi:hypothetical protein
MDWLSPLIPVGISGLAAGIYMALHFWNTAPLEPVEAPVTTTQVPIPREIRQEIDQDPEWWDREFHKELSRVSPKVEIDTGEDEYIEEVTFMGGSTLFVIPKPYEYLGCTCRDCKNARRMR